MTLERSTFELQLARGAGRLASFLLAAATGFAVTLDSFVEWFHAAYLSVTMIALISLHVLRFPRFTFNRECLLYSTFMGYMLFQLFWTDDILLARNTLLPSLAFTLVLIQFCTLTTYHNLHATLLGIFAGFSAGAALYALTSGFPFAYPTDFSYNAVAGLYLFGLFIALLLCTYIGSRVVFRLLALVLLLHVVATTSIKTNLGIFLGAAAAAFAQFTEFFRVVRRNLISLLVVASILGFAVASSEALVQALQRGMDRVALGVEVLQARDDVPGYSSVGSRAEWFDRGIRGWKENPLFGHGVEAFRSKFDITSHSTPIDLLYNSGLVGLILFYSIFCSLAWRLWSRRGREVSSSANALILGALVCYGSITLSGTMHYNSFLAAFVGISSALLARHTPTATRKSMSGR